MTEGSYYEVWALGVYHFCPAHHSRRRLQLGLLVETIQFLSVTGSLSHALSFPHPPACRPACDGYILYFHTSPALVAVLLFYISYNTISIMRVSKVLATVLLGFAVVEAANSDQRQGGQDSKEVSADNNDNNGGGNGNQKQAQGGNENSQGQQDGKKNGQQNQNQKGGKNGGEDNNNGDNGQGAQQNATEGLQPLPGLASAAQQLQPLPGLATLPPQSLKPLGSQPPTPPASLQPLGGGVQANATAALQPLGGNTMPPGTASSTIDLAALTSIANSVNGGAAAAATPGSFSNGTRPNAMPQAASAPSVTPAAFMTIPGGAGAGEVEAPMATATPPADILPGAVLPAAPQGANLEPLPGTISSDASLMALAPLTMTTMTLTVAASDGSTVLATMTAPAPANATAAAAGAGSGSSRNATATGGSGTVQVAGASASRGSGTTGVVLVLSGVVGLLGYLMG